jgi:hypothetical protein
MTFHAPSFGVPAFDPVLADAWRESALTVERSIRMIRQHLDTIEHADDRLRCGELLHSRAYVATCRKLLPWHLSVYLAALRQVTEAEIKMGHIGMPFAKSSEG